MTVFLIALSLALGVIAVGYARLGKADPGKHYNITAALVLIACISVAYLSGSHG